MLMGRLASAQKKDLVRLRYKAAGEALWVCLHAGETGIRIRKDESGDLASFYSVHGLVSRIIDSDQVYRRLGVAVVDCRASKRCQDPRYASYTKTQQIVSSVFRASDTRHRCERVIAAFSKSALVAEWPPLALQGCDQS
jgi:hypothetical protein